ncbi:MAG: toprim domain-containing protein [Proteobacteria bacterium]|nr:toprim domain-containing protein [Pseudomonadota bacterium]
MHDYKFREQGEFLRMGVCPSCGKKELFTPKAHPWVLRCGRLNRCGGEFHTKELYPDLFNDWSKLFPVTEKNPNAAADAYLRDGRGFDLGRVKGWYTQDSYFDHRSNEGTATVRFSLGGNIAWERFIDRPVRFGSQKARFIGSYRGMVWQPPSAGGNLKDEIWLVEGIFDAIALAHHGINAVSLMSCANFPSLFLKSLEDQCAASGTKRPPLVWALDTDAAGREATRKGVDRCRAMGWEVSAAVPPAGREKYDWNDLHQRDRLTPGHVEQYKHFGKIMLAQDAAEKARLLWLGSRKRSFHFDFENRLYWAGIDQSRYDDASKRNEDDMGGSDDAEIKAAQESIKVTPICNCRPEPLYYLSNSVTGEAWYYFRVNFPHDGAAVKDTFTPSQLSAASEFKKRLLSFPGAVWTGNSGQLDAVVEKWTYNIKRVETVEFIGYSLPHGAYIFNDLAVKDGKVIQQNDEDYFELGKVAIRSLSRGKLLQINADTSKTENGWFNRFYTAFGVNGVIALGYWMGSLFAEQVRDRYESWPFLEIVGEPGAGKTTLLEMLWKLLGRANYEGFDPMKSSHVGFLRSMSQVSNLPVVLIESDREDADGSKGRARQQFHWDGLKSLYNGGSLRTTGVKSAGNDTHDPQFRAALVISQNNPVQASQAIMERIVHLKFNKRHQSDDGRQAALELGRMTAAQLSGFVVAATTHEKEIMGLLEKRLPIYENRLAEYGIHNRRIQKNYAQVMVMVEALPMAVKMPKAAADEAIATLAGLAKAREAEISRDHPIVERFWEIYEYLDGFGQDESGVMARLNHSRDSGLIAVNLNHFVQVAFEARQQVPDLSDLKKYLPTSKRYRFVEANRTVCSAINDRLNANSDVIKRPVSIRCWVFKRGG